MNKIWSQKVRALNSAIAVTLAVITLTLLGWLAVAAFGVGAGAIMFLIVCALLLPRSTYGLACDATLILALIGKRLMDAYKTKLPMLTNFMWDFGTNIAGGNVKFGQEIIAQWPQIPTAQPHTPGDDLTSGAQSTKDLISESKMKIDQAVKVVIKVPTSDAVALELDPVFNAAVDNAGYALALYLVMRGMRQVTAATFTHEVVEALVDVDKETLGKLRIALNDQEAGVPRYGLVAPAAMSKLTDDPRIASGDYHGELVDANPYVSLTNLEGFSSIDEFPKFPVTPHLIGDITAVAATDVITVTAGQHGLPDGARVRFVGADLPAGLAAATDYFTRDTTSSTFKVAATRGGSAVNITDAGSGSMAVVEYEELIGFFWGNPAILFGVRGLDDNIAMAKRLGIPVPILSKQVSVPGGPTYNLFMWIDVKTHDIYVAAVLAFGVTAGRQAAGNDADSATDKSGVRLVTAAQP